MDDVLTIETNSLEDISFEEIDSILSKELDSQLKVLDDLKIERKEIGTPKKVINSVSQIIWEQFILQIAGTAGTDFIKENNNLNLSLKKADHILNSDSFSEGKMPSHNFENLDKYEERYEKWDRNFEKGTNHTKLVDNKDFSYRDVFDDGRDKGSASVHMDHTIPVKEIVTDKKAATFMSEEEKVAFANDKNINLKPLDSSANQSKRDRPMKEWLESERDGKHPDERFNIDKKELLERDDKARAEFEKRKDKGELVAKKEGMQSMANEAKMSLQYAANAVAVALLARLTSKIIQCTIRWLIEKEHKVKDLIESIKKEIVSFVLDFKTNVLMSIDIAITVILTQIFGEIIPMIRKALMFIAIGGKTLYEVGKYLKDPKNKNKDTAIIVLEVGKIVVTGLTTMGAIALSGAITSGLLYCCPALGVQIPLLGSVAGLLGIFFGGITAGICGAIVIYQIDGTLAGKMLSENMEKQINIQNDIIAIQNQQFALETGIVERKRYSSFQNIRNDFEAAGKEIVELKNSLSEERETENKNKQDDIRNILDDTEW